MKYLYSLTHANRLELSFLLVFFARDAFLLASLSFIGPPFPCLFADVFACFYVSSELPASLMCLFLGFLFFLHGVFCSGLAVFRYHFDGVGASMAIRRTLDVE